MSHVLLIALEAKSSAGFAPFLIAGSILLFLFGSMAALLAFGKGREHC